MNFKYRVWNTAHEPGAEPKYLYSGKVGIVSFCQHVKNHDLLDNVEQYVGQDRNDNSMYVGDEIRARITSDSVQTRGVIVFDHDLFCFSNENLAGMTPLYNLKDIEVIGNIRESA